MNTEGNKKKIIMLFIALSLILSVIFGVTFSYLLPVINNVETDSTVAFNAGTIAINYENGQNQINASEVLPGWTSIKEFSLTAINNTTISTAGAMNYAIKLIVEKNTFSDGAITYSIEGENVNNNGTVAYILPNSLKKGASEVILGYGLFDTTSDISEGVTHKYTLTIAFPNKTYTSQNDDSGKSLSAHVIITRATELSNLTIIDEKNNINKTMLFENNTVYQLPINASKNGAYFSGWTIESGKATISENKLTITGDTSIKANYSSTIKAEFAYTGNSEKFVAPVDGIYKIELWGASPNNDYNSYTKENAAYGGYTAGNIELKLGDVLYVYVGGSGTTFNCCTSQGNLTKSGGATDVRLIDGEWNDLTSLKSRIMVAGGGGTSYKDNSAQGGSNAGGLSSYKATVGNNWISYPSNQTSSGTATSGTKGGFGYGGVKGNDNYSSGAGGYWGGSAGPGGAGGSSFISGHTGCVAITSQTSTSPRTGTNGASCTTGTTDNLCSVHYSNMVFTDTVMIDGAGKSWTNVVGGLQLMPNYSGGTNTSGKGNSGNGYAKITVPEIKEGRDLSTITVVSEELKKVITIEAEKGVETEISVEGLTNSSLGFNSFEIEKGEATINKTKITPLSDTIVVRIIYKQLVNLEFAYTGDEKSFTIPVTGIYKIEAWGAQGGTATNGTSTYVGGYGGYSIGTISLNAGESIYINVGGAGKGSSSYNTTTALDGGYNGGGKTSSISGEENDHIHTSGGGATHIAFQSGLLKNLNNNLNNIIIVSGAGGGAFLHKGGNDYSGNGGSAGGYVGSSAVKSVGNGSQGLGGTQTEGGKCSSSDNAANCKKETSTIFGSFGLGGIAPKSWGSSGGAGLYGGGASNGDILVHGDSGGGGGSSYIGNVLLTNKVMYCYNCEESSDLSTKTISTTCHSSTPTENCAKEGNGYARITLIS